MSKNRKGSADADRHSPLDSNNSSNHYNITGDFESIAKRNTAICAAFVVAIAKRREMDRIKGRRAGQ